MLPFAALAAPWTWFAVRDADGILDLLANLLPVPVAMIAMVSLAAAAWRRRPLLAAVGVSWAAMGALAVVSPWLPLPGPPPVDPMRVVMANINYVNPSLSRALADVVAEEGDLVVLIESRPRVEQALAGVYPYFVRTPNGDPLVYSRYPVRMLEALPAASADRLELTGPSGRVIFFASHPPRPRLGNPAKLLGQQARHQRNLHELLSVAAAERAPTLVLGDLNLSDRSRAYRRFAGHFRDAMRAGLTGPTYVNPFYRPLLLRIDHLLVPRQWCSADARRFRVSGSDHRGVSALVGPCGGTGVR